MSYWRDGNGMLSLNTQPVARKQHTCDLCRGAILPGERYQRRAVQWPLRNGGLTMVTYHEHLHARCPGGDY